MKTSRLFAVALIALLSMGAAHAQVAKLTGLDGTVLVSQGDAMAAGANGQSLAVGQRIVTTAGSRVTVSYSNGCDVRLIENQRFVVREAGACSALIALVEGTGIAGAGAGTAAATGGSLFAGGSAGTAIGLAAVVGVAGLALAIDRATDSSGF